MPADSPCATPATTTSPTLTTRDFPSLTHASTVTNPSGAGAGTAEEEEEEEAEEGEEVCALTSIKINFWFLLSYFTRPKRCFHSSNCYITR